MGGYKAPGVVLHGCVSIRTRFRFGNERTLVPIRKRRPDGSELARTIKENVEEYVLDCAQRIHDA
jgi:hypothetical protein